jgi:hypothetical protein
VPEPPVWLLTRRELHRIAYPQVQVRLNGDFVVGGVDASSTECSGGASGFVVKGAGRTGQNSNSHVVNGRWLGSV